MSRRKPLTAGDIVSFFEEMPIEHARLVAEIVRTRVAKRTAQRDATFASTPAKPASRPPRPQPPRPPVPPKPPTTKPAPKPPTAEAAPEPAAI